jgi:hypothetical protein
MALKEQMFDSFVVMAETTLWTSLPIASNQIIFCQNHTATQIPSENFDPQWYLHLPNVFVFMYRCF